MTRIYHPQSLEELSGLCVGANALQCLDQSNVKLGTLPAGVISHILNGTSACSLLKLDLTGVAKRGFAIDRLWEAHVKERWFLARLMNRRYPQMSPQQYYYDEHFKECFNVLSRSYIDWAYSPEKIPLLAFKTPLSLVSTSDSLRCKSDYQFSYHEYFDHVMELIPRVKTLHLQNRQLLYLKENPRMLHALIHSIELLSLYHPFVDESLTCFGQLMNYGRVEYVEVSACNCDNCHDLVSVMEIICRADIDQRPALETLALVTDCELCVERKEMVKEVGRSHCSVKSLTVKTRRLFPLNHVRFMNQLRSLTHLEEFIYMSEDYHGLECESVENSSHEKYSTRQFLDAVSHLIKFGRLDRLQLAGAFHISVFNLLSEFCPGPEREIVDELGMDTFVDANITCRLQKSFTDDGTPMLDGIASLAVNVSCTSDCTEYCRDRGIVINPIITALARLNHLMNLDHSFCRSFSETLNRVFQTIMVSNSLVSLKLAGSYVSISGFPLLLSVIEHCSQLESLNLDYCEFPVSEESMKELAQVVIHSNLTTLRIGRNRLGSLACRFVVDVLTRADKINLKNLDISANQITFEDIKNMCSELIRIREDIQMDGYLLKNLMIYDVMDCCPDHLIPLWNDLHRKKIVQNTSSGDARIKECREAFAEYVARM